MKDPRRKGDSAISRYTALVRATPFAGLALAVLLVFSSAAADGKWSERKSSHFQLFESVGFARYSGPDGSREFERAVLATLEDAHQRVRDEIKVEPRSRVRVYVYEPSVFDASYSSLFGFRAAGFWDGAIHVRGGQSLDARLVSTLHHEYLHAALESVAPRDLWPAWLNEGLAELFERRALGKTLLDANEDARLRDAVASGAWIPLSDLCGPSLAGLSQAPAELAYLESYAAVEMIFRRAGRERAQSLVRELGRTHTLDRALQSSLRVTLAGLEAQLISEFR
jgi:hypothetical protein